MVAEPYNGSEVRGRHLAYCQGGSYGGPLSQSLFFYLLCGKDSVDTKYNYYYFTHNLCKLLLS